MSTKHRYTELCLGGAYLRLRRSVVVLGAALVVVGFAAMVLALMLGEYRLTPLQTINALFGGQGDPLARYFVQELRMPRVLGALLVGAALGTAGAIFQGITRNTLGSPDITGFTVGASSGAVLQIIVWNGGPAAISLGAIVGGLVTGGVVFLLSREGSGVHGMTFVLVGIGVSFTLQAINALLIVKASLEAAQTAVVWLAGSLHTTTWSEVLFLAAVLAVLLPLSFVLSRDLSVMMAGDDIAVGVGVPVRKRRIHLIGLGVALTAAAVALAGPVSFVALASPQLAKKLGNNAGAALCTSAMLGAVLVLVSDIIAQRLFAPIQLPVGVVTGVVGGVYLLWLIAAEWKASRA